MAATQKKYKVKKGDQVIVLAGRDKGKKGEIVKMLTEKDRVLVSGAQMVKRHQRPTPTNTGGIVEKEASIHVSNVALIDPKTDKPTRVGYKRLDNGEKVRIAKGSGEVIS